MIMLLGGLACCVVWSIYGLMLNDANIYVSTQTRGQWEQVMTKSGNIQSQWTKIVPQVFAQTFCPL